MSSVNRKFLLYILSVLILSAIAVLIYDTFEFRERHMTDVSVFCDETVENVGITNTRSLETLKHYVLDRARFERLDEFKLTNFYKDTIHLDDCVQGKLFSKRWNGARSVKLMLNGEEVVVTVLSEHITLFEE